MLWRNGGESKLKPPQNYIFSSTLVAGVVTTRTTYVLERISWFRFLILRTIDKMKLLFREVVDVFTLGAKNIPMVFCRLSDGGNTPGFNIFLDTPPQIISIFNGLVTSPTNPIGFQRYYLHWPFEEKYVSVGKISSSDIM